MTSENPTMARVLASAIEEKLVDINTCMPGKIQSYNPDTQTAEVQPVFKRKYSNKNEPVQLPLIVDVPVMQARTGKSFIHLPVKTGDYVLLVFSQRSLDMFRAKGGIEDPMNARKFHISDAIAIPGIFPDSEKLQSLSSEDLHVVNQSGKILIGKTTNPTEPILLGDVTSHLFTDLISIMNSILSILQDGDHVLTTSPGDPTIPNPDKASLISGLIADLADHKSTYIDTASTNIKSQVSFTERGG